MLNELPESAWARSGVLLLGVSWPLVRSTVTHIQTCHTPCSLTLCRQARI